MALNSYESTDSNSTVIRAQSFGSYTVQFVNCNLILFLILSSYNCVIGASPRLLFINCPMTGETTAKSIMSPPSFSTPYLACASLPWFFLVTHMHTRTYVQTHQIRLGMFFSFRFTSWHENPLLELLTSHTRLKGEELFLRSQRRHPDPGFLEPIPRSSASWSCVSRSYGPRLWMRKMPLWASPPGADVLVNLRRDV